MAQQDEVIECEVSFLSTQARRLGVEIDAIAEIARLRPATVQIDPTRSLIITPEFVLVMVGNVVSTIHRNPLRGTALTASTPGVPSGKSR